MQLQRLIFVLLFLTTFCFTNCRSKTESLPWNREKIIEVFTEVQLIEAKLETISNIQERDSLAHVYYQSLWDVHQTNQQEFDQVFEYYAQRPEKMEELYAEIITRLTLMQSQQQE